MNDTFALQSYEIKRKLNFSFILNFTVGLAVLSFSSFAIYILSKLIDILEYESYYTYDSDLELFIEILSAFNTILIITIVLMFVIVVTYLALYIYVQVKMNNNNYNFGAIPIIMIILSFFLGLIVFIITLVQLSKINSLTNKLNNRYGGNYA